MVFQDGKLPASRNQPGDMRDESATSGPGATGAPDPRPLDHDVVVIGGALAGASTALLLKQRRPDLRVLIVEKRESLGRRVGEATVEVSGYFLFRVLGLGRHLNEDHIAKNGLRFWFAPDAGLPWQRCSEIGGRYISRLPSWQMDRAVLDEEVLRRAREAGVEVWRPAAVRSVELREGGVQELRIRRPAGGPEEAAVTVRARWVVDASGLAAMLARRKGWLQRNEDHPTTAIWARWRNVGDLDDVARDRERPGWSDGVFSLRGTATNHLMGRGWWAWIIPLRGGDTSVGVVFDQRHLPRPSEGTVADRLRRLLTENHPLGRELLARAVLRDEDVHWRENLAYVSRVVAGDGFALVGDAAGFLDPFYSPGLDWLAYTVSAAVELIEPRDEGESAAERAARSNRAFACSYRRWFEAIYKDKYEYLGDFDLLRAGFLLDLGLYYLGIVSQPYRRGPAALTEPPFSTPPSTPFFRFMRFYNRRLAAMGRRRMRLGIPGRGNRDRRFLFGGFTLSPTGAANLLRGAAFWLGLELTEGWRTWLRGSPVPPVPRPVRPGRAVSDPATTPESSRSR
ncbi:MAG: NAD(P)/FAD-dependent oxidoreductase [Acidobacteriota bacterium]|jgi:flavin-dependent dehydrogenase